MATTRNEPTVKKAQFTGLQTKNDSDEYGFNGLEVAKNVDISRARKVRRRAGYEKKYSGSIAAAASHGGVFLFSSGSSLYQLHADFSTTEIRSDLTPSDTLAAYTLGGQTFYSNGIETGVLVRGAGRSFGLERPQKVDISTSSFGSLPSGIYQVGSTLIRDDGQESGFTYAGLLEFTGNNNGIDITVPTPSDPTVDATRIYLTNSNGSTFYRAFDVPRGTTSVTWAEQQSDLVVPLKTQFLAPPPAFDMIDFYNSRLLLVSGHLLFYTEPFAYELYDPRYNLIPFTGPITLLATTNSGVFIGTASEILFVMGDIKNPSNVVTVLTEGAVPGTLSYISGAAFGEEGLTQPVPMWVSPSSICAGMPDGSVVHLTLRTVDLPEAAVGTSVFRAQDNQHHFVSVIQS